jgi:hypothetical protein
MNRRTPYFGRQPLDEIVIDRLHRQRPVPQYHRHTIRRRHRIGKPEHAQNLCPGQLSEPDGRLQSRREPTLTPTQQPRHVVPVLRQQPLQPITRNLPPKQPKPPPDHQLVPINKPLQPPMQLPLPPSPPRVVLPPSSSRGAVGGRIYCQAGAVCEEHLECEHVVSCGAPGD